MAVSRLSQQSLINAFPKGNTIWDGTTATSAFDSIGTVVVGSTSQSSIVFSNIPQTYTHLHIRMTAKDSYGTNQVNNLTMYFNADNTYTNYRTHYIGADGANVSAAQYQLSGYYITPGDSLSSGSGYTNIATSTIFDVLDYTNTSKTKTVKIFSGRDQSGSGNITFMSSLWLGTAAVSTMTFSVIGGYSFVSGTSISVYGVK